MERPLPLDTILLDSLPFNLINQSAIEALDDRIIVKLVVVQVHE